MPRNVPILLLVTRSVTTQSRVTAGSDSPNPTTPGGAGLVEEDTASGSWSNAGSLAVIGGTRPRYLLAGRDCVGGQLRDLGSYGAPGSTLNCRGEAVKEHFTLDEHSTNDVDSRTAHTRRKIALYLSGCLGQFRILTMTGSLTGAVSVLLVVSPVYQQTGGSHRAESRTTVAVVISRCRASDTADQPNCGNGNMDWHRIGEVREGGKGSSSPTDSLLFATTY